MQAARSLQKHCPSVHRQLLHLSSRKRATTSFPLPTTPTAFNHSESRFIHTSNIRSFHHQPATAIMVGAIEAFYDPTTKAPLTKREPDATLDNIITWDDGTLEDRHDYIQHLFPLPERSPVNPSATVITKPDREAFLQRPELRDNLHRAFTRMCAFYGFDISGSTIRKDPDFESKARQTWLVSRDHNHLRITRIIRSMRFLGLEEAARQFTVALLEADEEDEVSKTSASFWCRAALWPLAKPPSWPREPEVGWVGEEADEAGGDGGVVEALERHCRRRGLDV